MSGRPALSELEAFAAVATHRSFRRAADELGLSPSRISHVIRGLEERMGVRLLHRTTRSVAPTEVGLCLLAQLKPILGDLDAALEAVHADSERTRGSLRINLPERVSPVLVRDVVPRFLRDYPDVSLELVVENRLVDIVEQGFDAGIRLTEAVPKDMIAVRFTAEQRFVAVAAPRYLADREKPSTPDELSGHRCIRLRLPSGKIYKWEFERRGQSMAVDVDGPLTLNRSDLTLVAALKGLGVAYVAAASVRRHVEEGRLVLLLESWCPTSPGMALYYPGHRHVQPALRAFIDVLRDVAGRSGLEV